MPDSSAFLVDCVEVAVAVAAVAFSFSGSAEAAAAAAAAFTILIDGNQLWFLLVKGFDCESEEGHDENKKAGAAENAMVQVPSEAVLTSFFLSLFY